MLITEMKSKETLCSLISGKVFIINCHGCKEVRFPEKEAEEFQKELAAEGKVTGILTTDYICNPDNMKLRLEKHMDAIKAAGLETITPVIICNTDDFKDVVRFTGKMVKPGDGIIELVKE